MTGALPGRCHIGADGLLRGPADITHNVPMPTRNGTPGGFGTAWGGVIHTEVGFEHSVIEGFNNPAAQASAFFSISMTGAIHQYGPLGKDWMAWTQEAGNPHYRGVEHEDDGNPGNPLTGAQLNASAQVFEAMSAFDGWPLEPTDNPNGGRGIIFHVDGGAAWGGHNCPGPVRERQRPAIIALAKEIRAGTQPAPAPVPASATLLGDSMLLLNKGQGAITPLALPAGTKNVRFFAAEGTAHLSTEFPGVPFIGSLSLSFTGGSHTVSVPAGRHALKVTRTDDGTGDVCAVPEA